MTTNDRSTSSATFETLPDIWGMEAQRDSRKFQQWMELALEASDAGIWEWDMETDEVFWDERTERTFGYESGRSPITYDQFAGHLPDDDLEHLEATIQQAINEDEPYQVTFRVRTTDGELLWLEARGAVIYEDGSPRRMIGVQTDITGEKRTDRALSVIRRCREVIIRTDSAEEILTSVCKELVQTTGYELAWVGTSAGDSDRWIQPVATSGEDSDFLDAIEEHFTKNEPHGPVSRALRNEETVVAQNFREDDQFVPWRNDALRHGFESCLCLPVNPPEERAGVIVLHASDPYAFAGEELESLEQLSEDVGLRLENLRTQQELEETTLSLEQKNKLLEEIHHRVKNNMQMISSILNLHSHNDARRTSQEILEKCQSRIQSMAKVHDLLYKSNNLAEVTFERYVREIVNSVLQLSNLSDDSVEVSLQMSPTFELSLSQAVPCGLIIYELVSNAVEHAFTEGRENRLRIELDERSGEFILRVIDNGPGFSDSIESVRSDTVGFDIVRALGKYELEGDLSIDSGAMTSVELTFPRDDARI